MRRFTSAWCLLGACCASVQAQDARNLAATCSACHGNATDRTTVRSLAAMPTAELAAAMRAFRSGERPGTLMPQLAKGYTNAEIDAIAAWYGARPPAR